MKRIVATIAVLLVAGVPVAAVAKDMFRATLGPVSSDAQYAGIEGEARLSDGASNDAIKISMRNLQPDTVYPWHLQVAAEGVVNPCALGAAQGPIVTAFVYETLTANNLGNAKATGQAENFTVDPAKTYYVNVHTPATGEPLACGVFGR
jgi:hypothetical protein